MSPVRTVAYCAVMMYIRCGPPRVMCALANGKYQCANAVTDTFMWIARVLRGEVLKMHRCAAASVGEDKRQMILISLSLVHDGRNIRGVLWWF